MEDSGNVCKVMRKKNSFIAFFNDCLKDKMFVSGKGVYDLRETYSDSNNITKVNFEFVSKVITEYLDYSINTLDGILS